MPANQLSLAIGNKGQNARLAAGLTGYKIDIISDIQAKELEENPPADEGSEADEAETVETTGGEGDLLTEAAETEAGESVDPFEQEIDESTIPDNEPADTETEGEDGVTEE